MALAYSMKRLELVQTDTGEIVLQADDGDEPLMQLRFNRKLTRILGADALALAQTMVESASYAFEFGHDLVEDNRSEVMPAEPPFGAGQNDPAATEVSVELEDPADPMIRLRTTPLH